MVVHAGEHSNRTDEFHAGLCGCTVVYSVHVVRTLCSDPNLPIPSLSATWHSLLHSRLWLHPGSTLMGVAVEFLPAICRSRGGCVRAYNITEQNIQSSTFYSSLVNRSRPSLPFFYRFFPLPCVFFYYHSSLEDRRLSKIPVSRRFSSFSCDSYVVSEFFHF